MNKFEKVEEMEVFNKCMVEIHPVKLCKGSMLNEKKSNKDKKKEKEETADKRKNRKPTLYKTIINENEINNSVDKEKDYIVVFKKTEAVLIRVIDLTEYLKNKLENLNQEAYAPTIVYEINELKKQSANAFNSIIERINIKVRKDSYTYHILYIGDQKEQEYINTKIFEDEKILSAVLDRSLVIYKDGDAVDTIKERISQGFGKAKFSFTRQIEDRAEYSSYASWSLMLILDYKENKDYLNEMALIEAQLQYYWYKIYRISKRKIVSYIKIKELRRRMNAIEDACDSDRIAKIKNILIKSSRVEEIVDIGKERADIAFRRFTAMLSVFSVVVAIIAVVISIINKLP